MTYIQRYLMRMSLFVGSIFSGALLSFNTLYPIYANNLLLNSTIFFCLVLGIYLCFQKIFILQKEQRWLETYEQGTERFPDAPKPIILAPLAIMLSEPNHISTISTLSARSILSGVETRLEELREVHRYIIGLLIFLGLLGTFWGLSETIGGITGVINSIDMGTSGASDAFKNLKQGLQSPLSGMGTAFSCSMFGLASSLIVGFLDLQVSKALTHFYNTLEDRLAANTRLSGAADLAAGGVSGPAYTLGLLEQTIEALASLQAQMRRSEDNRLGVTKAIQQLAEKTETLTEQMLSHQTIMKKIAQNQIDLQENMLRTMQLAQTAPQIDDIVKHHLRNMDATASRMLDEMVEGRRNATQELKSEIRVIARTLSAIANGQEAA